MMPFTVPNPPRQLDIDFSGTICFADLTTRKLPIGSTFLNVTTSVDWNQQANTWTVRAANNPSWLGSYGAFFMSASYYNFTNPVTIGANTNGSCTISGSGQLQADGVTADCPTVNMALAGVDFVDYLTVVCSAPTVTSAQANIFAFLYKPLAAVGQTKVRIRRTSPSTASPDAEEMIIDNTHSSLVIGRWVLMTNAHPAVSTPLIFTAGTKQVYNGSSWVNVYFSGSVGANYCVDLNTVTLTCLNNAGLATSGWFTASNASSLAQWPTVFPQQAVANVASTAVTIFTSFPANLKMPVSGLPVNDICGYFEGYIHRGAAVGAVARLCTLHYNDNPAGGGTTGTGVQGLGFHPGGQGTSNLNLCLSQGGTPVTETYPSTQEMTGLLPGIVVPLENRSDFVYTRLFWRKNSIDGVKVFCNGVLQTPVLDQPTMAGPFVLPGQMNEFLLGVARNMAFNAGTFIATRAGLWPNIPFTDADMLSMTSLGYGAPGLKAGVPALEIAPGIVLPL